MKNPALPLLALLIAITGCAQTLPARHAAADPAEQALLAQYPQAARRQGDTLRLLSRGGWITYRNTDCEKDPDSCISYVLDQAWHGGRFFGMKVGYYEGEDYIVADTQSVHLHTGGPPLFSPGGTLFATAVYSEAYETAAEGVRIWAVDFPMRNIRTIPPDVLGYPEDVQWLSDKCLRVSAIVGSLYDDQGRERPRGTYYLTEAAPEWRLEEKEPLICRSGA
jgi:hypothetical protein